MEVVYSLWKESLVDISFSVYWPLVIPSEESCRMQKVTSEVMQGPHGQEHLASCHGAASRGPNPDK